MILHGAEITAAFRYDFLAWQRGIKLALPFLVYLGHIFGLTLDLNRVLGYFILCFIHILWKQ